MVIRMIWSPKELELHKRQLAYSDLAARAHAARHRAAAYAEAASRETDPARAKRLQQRADAASKEAAQFEQQATKANRAIGEP
jgi:hypothetical protein